MKWFDAIRFFLMSSSISSYELSGQIGVEQYSAYMMEARLRNCLKKQFDNMLLNGTIEIDETWIAPDTSKNLRINKADTKYKQKMVLGMKQRAEFETIEEMKLAGRKKRKLIRPAKLILFLLGNHKGTIKAENINYRVFKHIHPDSKILTDGHTAYSDLEYFYSHEVNVHSYKEEVEKKNGTKGWVTRQKFVDYRLQLDGTIKPIHTNGIEANWKHLKRLIAGAYISISYDHALEYLMEYAFRFNIKHLSPIEKFNVLLSLCCQTSLKYIDIKKFTRFKAFYYTKDGVLKYRTLLRPIRIYNEAKKIIDDFQKRT